MTFFKDKVPPFPPSPPSPPPPPPPPPPQVSFRVPWLGYIGIRPRPRGQRPSLLYNSLIRSPHVSFRSCHFLFRLLCNQHVNNKTIIRYCFQIESGKSCRGSQQTLCCQAFLCEQEEGTGVVCAKGKVAESNTKWSAK